MAAKPETPTREAEDVRSRNEPWLRRCDLWGQLREEYRFPWRPSLWRGRDDSFSLVSPTAGGRRLDRLPVRTIPTAVTTTVTTSTRSYIQPGRLSHLLTPETEARADRKGPPLVAASPSYQVMGEAWLRDFQADLARYDRYLATEQREQGETLLLSTSLPTSSTPVNRRLLNASLPERTPPTEPSQTPITSGNTSRDGSESGHFRDRWFSTREHEHWERRQQA